MIVLLAARAARLENQDAIDAAIINMLADPKEVNLEQIFTLIQKFCTSSILFAVRFCINN